MKVCSNCPSPGKCRAAGKCLNKPSGSKTMGKGGGYGAKN